MYVYMVRCVDGSLYTGWTTDVQKRIKAHNDGTGAKYTRGKRPVKLVYTQKLDDKKAAMCREAAIKKLPKTEKESLVNTWQNQNTNGKDKDGRN